MRKIDLLVFISRYTGVLMLALSAVLLIGCDSMESGGDEIEVDLDALFAAPTPGEIEAIRAEWATRDVSAADIAVLAVDTVQALGNTQVVRVVSHTVAGVTHVGAIVAPVLEPARTLPVLVYNHFGDEGVDLDGTLSLISLGLNGLSSEYVFVVPSFRDETLTSNGITYQSDGPPSPWDFDVDDSIALLNVALELVPDADESRIGVIGISRGGGVSLLMAARDPRIEFVVDFFGPTNFFLKSSREETENALRGNVRDLPGLDYLNSTWVFPWKEGNRSIEEVRLEYIRRSPVYFSDALPVIQVHHGAQDDIVPVEHAESLEEFFVREGKPENEYELFIYPDAGHDLIQMPESFSRSATFINNNTSL